MGLSQQLSKLDNSMHLTVVSGTIVTTVMRLDFADTLMTKGLYKYIDAYA